MDIKSKIMSLILLLILFYSCDPSISTSYKIKNNSSEDFTINLYEFNNDIPEILDNASGTKTEIFSDNKYPGGLGFFGKIHEIDSVIVIMDDDNRKIRWVNPGGRGFIIPEDGIGEVREDVPLDIYNRDNWELTISGDDERWVFIINEEDLALFE